MTYGRIAKVYDYGGASVWDPQSKRRYAVAPEWVTQLALEVDQVVAFEPTEDGRWARDLRRVSIHEVPQAVRAAMSDQTTGLVAW